MPKLSEAPLGRMGGYQHPRRRSTGTEPSPPAMCLPGLRSPPGSLPTCLTCTWRSHRSFHGDPGASLTMAALAGTGQALSPAETRVPSVTEMVRTFQKRFFCSLKASLRFLSVIPPSACLAPRPVILILTPRLSLENTFPVMSHPSSGFGSNLTSEKSALITEPHVSPCVWPLWALVRTIIS